jgi:hypothetical protein
MLSRNGYDGSMFNSSAMNFWHSTPIISFCGMSTHPNPSPGSASSGLESHSDEDNEVELEVYTIL